MTSKVSFVRVADLEASGVLTIDDGYRVTNKELGPTGIPFVRGGDIGQNGEIRVDVSDHIRPEFVHRVASKLTKAGDVAFITKGTVGRVGRLQDNQPPIVFAPQVCFWRSLDREKLVPRFLYYLLRSAPFQANLNAVKTHGSMVADYVSLADQRRFLLPLPPPTVQKAAARILGALDDKSELNRRTGETLEAMARATFRSWFVDFEDQTEFVDRRMPRGWSASTLQEHVTLQRGTTYSGSMVGLPGPALLGLGSIEPGGGFRDEHYKTYGGECPEKLMLFPGDLFVALKGATKDGSMVGSIARVPPSVASGRLTQDTVKLQFMKQDSGIDRYIYWLLRMPHYRDYCARRITGSAQVGLSRDDFLNYPVPRPPDTLLAAFAELESSLSQRQDLLAAECKSLAALRDTLLPKLLSGEFRVPEAERAVEAVL